MEKQRKTSPKPVTSSRNATTNTKTTKASPTKEIKSENINSTLKHLPFQGKCYNTPLPELSNHSIIIEVLLRSKQNAISLINSISEANTNSRVTRILAIGLNGQENSQILDTCCQEIVTYMEQKKVSGYCMSFTWISTTDEGDGYIFPFKEARGLLTTHPGAKKFHTDLRSQGYSISIRSTDEDATSDPLLNTEKDDEIGDLIDQLAITPGMVGTGGYDWDSDSESVKSILKKAGKDLSYATKISDAIKVINEEEHLLRSEVINIADKSVYMPEPNTYMPLDHRLKGTEINLNVNQIKHGQSQQGEGIVFASASKYNLYNSNLKVTKPLKSHLDNLINEFAEIIKNQQLGKIDSVIETHAHQSHLRKQIVEDIWKWHGATYSESVKNNIYEMVKQHKNECVRKISEIFRSVV